MPSGRHTALPEPRADRSPRDPGVAASRVSPAVTCATETRWEQEGRVTAPGSEKEGSNQQPVPPSHIHPRTQWTAGWTLKVTEWTGAPRQQIVLRKVTSLWDSEDADWWVHMCTWGESVGVRVFG